MKKEKGLSIAKIVCIGATVFGAIGAALIDGKRDLDDELPRLSAASNDETIDTEAKEVEEA